MGESEYPSSWAIEFDAASAVLRGVREDFGEVACAIWKYAGECVPAGAGTAEDWRYRLQDAGR